MEKAVQPIQADNFSNSRLRFVFRDAVITLGLAADATFEDIARNLEDVAAKHCGKPVAIDVTLGAPGGMVCRAFSQTKDC
jgi:hypothetical protein